jgi:serine/threonine protein kinase
MESNYFTKISALVNTTSASSLPSFLLLLRSDLNESSFSYPVLLLCDRHESRVLYCKSEHERENWLTQLQHAAQVVPIEEDYVIGKELGRGRFSRVCECVHKLTGIRYAVKIIEKATIEPEEKALLRTEIAGDVLSPPPLPPLSPSHCGSVLKLVNHPNIIKMQGIYESRSHMYIVMEKLVGGELFERIVGRPRFSEDEAAKLIRPLLESVAYLHDLGIVHRDIKPENILCGENLEDIKIADFGLSKVCCGFLQSELSYISSDHRVPAPFPRRRCFSRKREWIPPVGHFLTSLLKS